MKIKFLALALALGLSSPALAVSLSPAGDYDARPSVMPTSWDSGAEFVLTGGGAAYGATNPGIGTQYIALLTGTITYSYTSLLSSVQLFWGTPDATNTISFYNGSTLVDTINGWQLPAGFYNLTASGAFDSVKLSNSAGVFETSGVVGTTAFTPVPGPEAGAGLGALALGGLALCMKRRRKEAAAAF